MDPSGLWKWTRVAFGCGLGGIFFFPRGESQPPPNIPRTKTAEGAVRKKLDATKRDSAEGARPSSDLWVQG